MFTARHRCWADSTSLKTTARAAVREPAPRVTLTRSRTMEIERVGNRPSASPTGVHPMVECGRTLVAATAQAGVRWTANLLPESSTFSMGCAHPSPSGRSSQQERREPFQLVDGGGQISGQRMHEYMIGAGLQMSP